MSNDEGPKIKRDKHNQLDQSDAQTVIEDVTKKLITTQRDFQKDQTFNKSRTIMRDIVVKIVIYQKNTVAGKIVRDDRLDPGFEKLSDDPLDPYLYKYVDHIDGEISAKDMPMKMSNAGKWAHGCFKALMNYLARMNVFNGT